MGVPLFTLKTASAGRGIEPRPELPIDAHGLGGNRTVCAALCVQASHLENQTTKQFQPLGDTPIGLLGK